MATAIYMAAALHYEHQGDNVRIEEVSVLEKKPLYGFRPLRDQVNRP